jgi:hypothetical protein
LPEVFRGNEDEVSIFIDLEFPFALERGDITACLASIVSLLREALGSGKGKGELAERIPLSELIITFLRKAL